MTVQGAGYTVDGFTGAYISGVQVDGNGVVNGTMNYNPNGQASRSGFRIDEAIPEPGTLFLLPAGCALFALRRHSR